MTEPTLSLTLTVPAAWEDIAELSAYDKGTAYLGYGIMLFHLSEKNALAARIGKEEEVLVEEIDEQGNGVGYTGGYMRVCVKDGKPGEIVRVRITGADDEELTGEMEK